ncbi:MAG: EFR1 family ferrodoxin [Oscillospiraceae bacterium]|nr:EFR1 family ferrodoxin [Candidatus Limimonas coprohippi]MCQ2488109.1 EFR1 family ferrodoxin [Clostridia bacterium]
MIYYFSGTGNSEWAAKELAVLTNDTAEFITKDTKAKYDEKLGIIFPIYAWGVPGPVEDFLKTLEIPEDTYFYAVATCGSNCGRVDDQIMKLTSRKLNAILSLSLPNNYIQGGDCDTPKKAIEKFKKAKPKLLDFANSINNKEVIKVVDRGPLPGLMTEVIHPSFIKYATSDKKFSVNDDCSSCGACVNNCPLDNITLKDGKPIWNGNCSQCTSCINRCPKNAIQYGASKPSRVRYYFKEEYVK